jgi:hypothetical protein
MTPGDAGLLNEVTGADWTDTGEMLIAAGPNGGIIDRNPTMNEWFIIFNDDRPECDEWFTTRADAIAAFVEATPYA